VDPFWGSGTTGLAALKNGRKFLGFELREDYCRIAAERLRYFEAQPVLAFGT
jgi:DNA modification methylase